MPNGREMSQTSHQVANDLEPYLRLIEIQKQLIEMARRHEQTRRECEALRAQVAREAIAPLRWPKRLRQAIHRSASKLFGRPAPVPAPRLPFRKLEQKQPHSC
jgi:hypothetical protein